MSPEVVDLLCQYSIDTGNQMMIIASRNQVDFDSGYVLTTSKLVDRVRRSGASNIMLCRDHAGPYFKDADRDLDEGEAINQTINTITNDIENGIELVHIDVSRVSSDKHKVAETLIEKALSMNPNIMLEFGSEENVGESCGIAAAENDLAFVKRYQGNMRFFVAQTGSLVKEQQVGRFDAQMVSKLSGLVHAQGLLFKEHNADYLSKFQVVNRFKFGIDAMNIAPQLGVAHTRAIKQSCLASSKAQQAWIEFSEMVLKAGKWRRWVSNGTTPGRNLAVDVAGHYHFSSAEAMRVLELIDHGTFLETLKKDVYEILDTYYGSLR